jgi:DNA modification methylase
MENLDLFGNPIAKKNDLKEMFGENPFSILDAKSGSWRNRKRKWLNLGIQSEVGRNAKTFSMKNWENTNLEQGNLKNCGFPSDTSVFDPVLCELMYKWFCPIGGSILDPFAGSQSLRIACNKTNRRYIGFEIDKDYYEKGCKWFESESAQLTFF